MTILSEYYFRDLPLSYIMDYSLSEFDYICNLTFLMISFIVGCPLGVMVKAMDCRMVVIKFVLQLHYYVHFQANTLGKGMNPLILPAMG